MGVASASLAVLRSTDPKLITASSPFSSFGEIAFHRTTPPGMKEERRGRPSLRRCSGRRETGGGTRALYADPKEGEGGDAAHSELNFANDFAGGEENFLANSIPQLNMSRLHESLLKDGPFALRTAEKARD